MYYVTLLIALPLAVSGRGWVPPSEIGWVFATNLFAVQMWGSFPPLSFVGPAWTLAFFYLVFPWLPRWHQGQSDRALNRWITILAVVQAVLFFGLGFAIEPVDRRYFVPGPAVRYNRFLACFGELGVGQ